MVWARPEPENALGRPSSATRESSAYSYDMISISCTANACGTQTTTRELKRSLRTFVQEKSRVNPPASVVAASGKLLPVVTHLVHLFD